MRYGVRMIPQGEYTLLQLVEYRGASWVVTQQQLIRTPKKRNGKSKRAKGRKGFNPRQAE
jgi:hypothetical protein